MLPEFDQMPFSYLLNDYVIIPFCWYNGYIVDFFIEPLLHSKKMSSVVNTIFVWHCWILFAMYYLEVLYVYSVMTFPIKFPFLESEVFSIKALLTS